MLRRLAALIALSVGLRFWQEMKSLVQAESRRRWCAPKRRCGVVAADIALPFMPFATALPAGFSLYLALVLPAYCLLTQLVKGFYLRRFRTWR